MKKNTYKVLYLVVILSFTTIFIIWKYTEIFSFTSDENLNKTIETLTYLLLIFLSASIFFPITKITEKLGLNKNGLFAIGLALLISLPMLVGYSLVSKLNSQFSFELFYRKAFLAATLEEILFRGFLFGFLFRYCRWGFLPAALLSAFIFAIGHLYQANNLGSALGVLSITGMGGVWFAWLYIEWEKNLWVPIFLHMLMNTYWGMFTMGTNAAGGLYGNVFRALTILLSIMITVYHIKKRKHFEISYKRLFRNNIESYI